jgi:hypothetical protein
MIRRRGSTKKDSSAAIPIPVNVVVTTSPGSILSLKTGCSVYLECHAKTNAQSTVPPSNNSPSKYQSGCFRSDHSHRRGRHSTLAMAAAVTEYLSTCGCVRARMLLSWLDFSVRLSRFRFPGFKARNSPNCDLVHPPNKPVALSIPVCNRSLGVLSPVL